MKNRTFVLIAASVIFVICDAHCRPPVPDRTAITPVNVITIDYVDMADTTIVMPVDQVYEAPIRIDSPALITKSEAIRATRIDRLNSWRSRALGKQNYSQRMPDNHRRMETVLLC